MMKRVIFVMSILAIAGCSNSGTPENESANDNTISRPEAILLSENIRKTIAMNESTNARNLDRIYLVGKTSEDKPICEQYSQRVVGVTWVQDEPVAKFDIWHKPVTCPESADEHL